MRSYRAAYTALRQAHKQSEGDVAYTGAEQEARQLSIKHSQGLLNTCLVDMCDVLWKNQTKFGERFY